MTEASAGSPALLEAITRADGLVLRSTAARLGLDQELRREFSQGRLIRLRFGVYVSRTVWSTLDLNERYLCRIRAYAAMSSEPPVFSHHSAAAIWGLPRSSSWPTDVHITVPQASGGRSRPGVVRHALEQQPPAVERLGLRVVTVADTAIMMALGFIAFVDFFWRLINKVGEFDGHGKYLKPEYTHGRTTAQVVMAEKEREDRVRALGPTSARWDWPIARDLATFGRFLTRQGIPRAR